MYSRHVLYGKQVWFSQSDPSLVRLRKLLNSLISSDALLDMSCIGYPRTHYSGLYISAENEAFPKEVDYCLFSSVF